MLPVLLMAGLAAAGPKKKKPDYVFVGAHGGLNWAPTGMAYDEAPGPVPGWSAGVAGQKNLKGKGLSYEMAAGYHRFATPGADTSWAILVQQAWRLRLWKAGSVSQHAGLGLHLEFGVMEGRRSDVLLMSVGPALTTTLQWAPDPSMRLGVTPYLAPQANLGGALDRAFGQVGPEWSGTYIGHGGIAVSVLLRTVMPSSPPPVENKRKKKQY